MPQAVSFKNTDNPYGKGSLHNELLDATLRRRRRAAKINEGETLRLKMYEKIVLKHKASQEERLEKVVDKIRKRLEEMQAHKRVLRDYKADRLTTMKWGFKPGSIRTEEDFQRYKIETRIYHCGFTVGTLQPEINKSIEAGKPERKKEAQQRDQLEMARLRSNFMIDRRITNEAMRREKIANDDLKVFELTERNSTLASSERHLTRLSCGRHPTLAPIERVRVNKPRVHVVSRDRLRTMNTNLSLLSDRSNTLYEVE